MIKNLVRKTSIFYQLSVATLIFGTLGIISYFWINGSLKQQEKNGIYESSYIVKSIEKNKSYKKIGQLAAETKIREAITELENYGEKVKIVNSHITDDKYEQVEKNVNKLKAYLATFVKFPRTSEIVKVLTKKMNSFNGFVKDNGWRRLTRMSSVTLSKIEEMNNPKKVFSKNRDAKSLVKKMNEIVEKSILKRGDKQKIFSRLGQMSEEFSMIESQAKAVKKLDQKVDFLMNSQKQWLESVAPKISESIIKGQQTNRSFIISLLAVIAVSVLLFVLGHFVNRHWVENGQRVLEANIVDVVENLVRGKPTSKEDEFSDAFYHAIDKNAAYALKRMSFGLVFQDTLPIPSVLLDSNLKVVWANETFSDAWGVSEDKIASHYLSWDLLKKQTNLNDSNPIIDALKNNLAGIYQVKVRNSQSSQSQPFEMYVRPVQIKNETSIMAYFYPLSNVQDTIDLQAKTTLAPIRETLKSLESNGFDEVSLGKLKIKYQEAGIEDLYHEVRNLIGSFSKNHAELEERIETLSSTQKKLFKTISMYEDFQENNQSFSKEIAESFKSLKQSIIDYSVLKEQLVENFENNTKKLVSYNEDLFELANKSNENSGLLEKIAQTSKDINPIRFSLKGTKQQLDDQITRLKSDGRNDEKITLVKQLYFEFSKSLQDLDVKVSKIENLMNDVTLESLKEYEAVDERKLAKDLERYKGQFLATEEELIATIKTGYNSYRKISKTEKSVTEAERPTIN